jgi:hypothetical protein
MYTYGPWKSQQPRSRNFAFQRDTFDPKASIYAQVPNKTQLISSDIIKHRESTQPSSSSILPKLLPIFPLPHLVTNPIANQSINLMITGTKTPQLHLLPILNLLRITVSPLHRYLTIRICIYQYIKSTVSIEFGEKCYGSSDLAEDGLDLGLDFCFGFLLGRSGRCVTILELEKMLCIYVMDVLRRSVLFVCRLLRGFFRRWFVEDLDLVSNTHILVYCLILK